MRDNDKFLLENNVFSRYLFLEKLKFDSIEMGNLLSKDLGFSEEDLYDFEEKIHGLEDCDDVLILLLKYFLKDNPHADLQKFYEGKLRRSGRTAKISYEETTWGQLIQDPEIKNSQSKVGKLFRRRFRVPFPFSSLLGSDRAEM